MSNSTFETTTYLQVEPKWSSWQSPITGEKALDSVSVVASTKRRPERQRPGTVVVKLTLRIPEAAFLPLRPEATIVIPEGMTVTAPIEVVAEDPGD